MKKVTACLSIVMLIISLFSGMVMPVSAEIANPVVLSLSSVEGAQVGDTVTVDLMITENHYLVNGQIVIHYDPNALEIQEVWDDVDNPYFDTINQQIIKSSAMWAFAVPTPGEAKFAFAASSSVGTTAGGTIYTLTFKVLEGIGTETALTVTIPEMCSNDGVTANGEDFNTDPQTVGGTVSTVLPGDIVIDGELNLQDVSKVFYYLNGLDTLDEAQLLAADYNKSGSVTLLDATMLFYHVSGL